MNTPRGNPTPTYPDLANIITDRKIEVEKTQEALNKVFSLSRREKMIAGASVDVKGRKVKYYRYMAVSKIEKLLRTGVLTAYDYFDLNAEIDRKRFRSFLEDFLIEGKKSDSIEDEMNHANIIRSKSIDDLMLIINPQFDTASFKYTNAEALKFANENVPMDFIKKCHTRCYHLGFSSHLSASVRGPSYRSFYMMEHYDPMGFVEMVLPDNAVVYNEHGFDGEKEVLLSEIKLEHVSRIHISRDQFIKEVIADSNEPIGPFFEIQAEKRGINDVHTPEQALCEWRSSEPTVDCLPLSLLEALKKTQEVKTQISNIIS